jgi:hypothetical protein
MRVLMLQPICYAEVQCQFATEVYVVFRLRRVNEIADYLHKSKRHDAPLVFVKTRRFIEKLKNN